MLLKLFDQLLVFNPIDRIAKKKQYINQFASKVNQFMHGGSKDYNGTILDNLSIQDPPVIEDLFLPYTKQLKIK